MGMLRVSPSGWHGVLNKLSGQIAKLLHPSSWRVLGAIDQWQGCHGFRYESWLLDKLEGCLKFGVWRRSMTIRLEKLEACGVNAAIRVGHTPLLCS